MSTSRLNFKLEATATGSRARAATFRTLHNEVKTPLFMPVGTRGTVKGMTPAQVKDAGSTVILANTYHLHLRPGEAAVKQLGGLHKFMNWDGPILTDSGGYQVFSMSDMRELNEEGVKLKSIVDGAIVHLTPENVMQIEVDLGADIIMAFDHCPSDPLNRDSVEAATMRTGRWLQR